MKSALLVVAAAALGMGIGFGWTAWERVTHEELFLPADFAARSEQLRDERRAVAAEKGARLELLDGSEYKFGSMERMSKRRHTFRIRSVGDAPLTLKVVRSTCKCTVSAVNSERIAPGEVAEMTVEWTGQMPVAGSDFRQSVEVATNDPDNDIVALVISGIITESIRVLPEELVVGRFSAESGMQSEFRLYAFRSEEIDILESVFEDPETAGFFDVSYERLPAEEYEREKGAICGLLGKLTVKSGLPLGPINQTIRIRAQADKEVTLFLPVQGVTTGDILLASSDVFEANRSLVDFGTLERNESAKAVLQMFVKGDHRHTTQFSVGKTDPDGYLHVEVSEPEELNNGKTLRYRVTVEIPSGLEPINRLGAEYAKHGRVVLETTHPTMKQVPINVRFAIEN